MASFASATMGTSTEIFLEIDAVSISIWTIFALGASTLGKEEAGQLAQRQMKFIQHLQAALIRIENKTYGICRQTGKLIPKERLMAVPHATLSVEAKESGRKR